MATCLFRNTFSLLLRTHRFYWDFTAETSPVAAFCVKKKLADATFIPVHDHCVLCRNVSAQNLHMLDSVYHRAPGFIANCGFLTHQPVLYATSQKCTPACASLLLLATQGTIPVWLDHQLWLSDVVQPLVPKSELNWEREPLSFLHLLLEMIYRLALTCWTWSILVVLNQYSVYNCFQLWFYHHFWCALYEFGCSCVVFLCVCFAAILGSVSSEKEISDLNETNLDQ